VCVCVYVLCNRETAKTAAYRAGIEAIHLVTALQACEAETELLIVSDTRITWLQQTSSAWHMMP